MHAEPAEQARLVSAQALVGPVEDRLHDCTLIPALAEDVQPAVIIGEFGNNIGDCDVRVGGDVTGRDAQCQREPQRKSPTGWDTRDSDRSDTIPYPAAVTLLLLAPCAPGTWQLAYDVQASYQGTTAHETNASDPLTVTSHADCGVAR